MMGGFRRFVIAFADIMAVCGIIIATVVGVSWGRFYGRIFGFGIQVDQNAVENIGGLIGGAAGFLTTCLLSAFLFTLSEIVANTRELVLLQRGQERRPDTGSPETRREPPPLSGSSERFTRVHQELSELAAKVIRRAKSEGYDVRASQEGDEVVFVKGGVFVRFVNNRQLETFGRKQEWI
jgi:hypothetical protein